MNITDPATTLALLNHWLGQSADVGSPLYRATLVHCVARRGGLIDPVSDERWAEMMEEAGLG